jgi:hypothetical protein
MAFAKLIFTNVACSEENYVEISHIEFHPNWTVNVKNMDINLRTLFSKI